MSDNLKDRGPQDRSRINVNEDWELRYWTTALGVTEDQLRKAVAKVGVSDDDVRAELGIKENVTATYATFVNRLL